MNKIKKIFSGMIDSVKETFNRFPVTTILVFILTLITAFLIIDTDFSKSVDELIAHIVCIGGFTAVATWFVESIFEDKKNVKRNIAYIISFIIAILIDRAIKHEWIEESILARWICEYVIACFLGAVYVLIKKSDIKFEKYILNLILNLKRASIIFGIVSIGFLILYAIFTVLILNSLKFYIVLKIICLFTGFYYIPVVMNAFANKEAEDTKFNRAVFSKVLLPLIALAMIIVYMYIVKIFLITEVPKNELFSILSMIFVFAFPVYIVNKNYAEKDTVLYKVNRVIPYLYIPFIFLQMYAMGIRINEYGVTTSRYMAIILIIYEIGAIVLSVVKESEKLREIVLFTILLSVIIFVTPMNYDTLPKLSQKRIVDKYVANGVKFDDLDEINQKKFSGAYKYIKYDEEYINPALSQVEKEKLSSYNTYRNSYNDHQEENVYVTLNKTVDALNIEGYSKIYEIPYSYNDEGTVVEYKRSKYTSTYGKEYNTDIEFSVDLAQYINQLIESYEISQETADRVFKEMSIVTIDGSRDLYLTELAFRYDKSNKEVENIRIEGFLLEK